MKTIIVSLMTLALSTGAMATDTGKLTGTKASATTEASSKPNESTLMLQRENELLKLQLEKLSNNNAELSSTINFQQSMSKLRLLLKSESYETSVSDFKAEIAYNLLMTRTIQKIQAERMADLLKHKAVSSSYASMMSKMLTTFELW